VCVLIAIVAKKEGFAPCHNPNGPTKNNNGPTPKDKSSITITQEESRSKID